MRNKIGLLIGAFLLSACTSSVTFDPEGELDMESSGDVGSNNGAVDMGSADPDLGDPDDMRASPDMGTAVDMGDLTDMGMVDPPGPSRYNPDLLLSPFTANVVDNLRDIRASASGPNDDRFMKIGASGTVNSNFLDCFSGTAVDLSGRSALQPTITYFGGNVPGGTPWNRDTLAAVVGRTASWVQTGTPSPLESEIAAINPRFALVNYGTNDMQAGTSHQTALWPFWNTMWTLLNGLVADGIVPIVTGLNPRGDTAIAALWVPTYNEVTRAMAQALQLPYLDLYNSVVDLPSQGLISDGLHGNTSPAGACVFTTAGLQYNYNVRNLSTLQILDSVRTKVLDSQPATELAGLSWSGIGTTTNPILIDRFPFSHSDSTIGAPSDQFDAYPACDTGQNESGGEVVYKFELSSTKRLRAMVFDDAGDIDVHHLLGTPDAAQCQNRGDRIIQGTFAAGTHYLVFDTFVGTTSGPLPGEYTMVVVECEAGDIACN